MQDTKTQELVRLAPRMAHHIRDELSVVQTAMDLLINDKSIASEARNKVTLLKGQLHHVDGLARQFLGITGNLTNRREVLDIRDVVSEMASLLQHLLGKDIQLRLALDRDLWPIRADLEQFEEMLGILAVNARDAMPRGGCLRIRATNLAKAGCKKNAEGVASAADYVLIEVADTGTGIAKDIVDRIFEPFFSTKGPGCGFGLAKVYGTIRQMNGHIKVESEVGKGTAFRIFLPRYEPTTVNAPRVRRSR
jgi:two-component system, cell cycle sensor histidine kinase and response regulator CckA